MAASSQETVNSTVIESLLEKNDIKAIFTAIKQIKEREVFDEILDFRFCKNSGTLFHAIARYCNFRNMRMLLDYLEETLGGAFFKFHVNENKDKSDRTFFIIACKHGDPLSIDELLSKYQLDVSWYSHHIGVSALTYLVRRRKFDLAFAVVSRMNTDLYSVEKDWFKRDINEFISSLPNEQVLSKTWLDGITVPFNKEKKPKQESEDCYTSKITGTTYIRERPFKSNRQRQTIRHIATQLFLRFKSQYDVPYLEDVQILHIERARKSGDIAQQSFLFLACTPFMCSDIIAPDFKTRSFQDMLLKIYKNVSDPEGTKRSIRYSKKIKSRIYGNDFTHTKKSKNIRDIIKHGPIRLQKITPCSNGIKMPFFTFTENVTYVLHSAFNKAFQEHHAEAVLCEVAEFFRRSGNFEYAIYGKTRSCLPCCGRMENMKATYNKHPSFISFKQMEKLKPKEAAKALKVMFESPIYISRVYAKTKNGGQRLVTNFDYDTASDSDID